MGEMLAEILIPTDVDGDADPVFEVELDADGDAWLRASGNGVRAVFAGNAESLIRWFCAAADLVVDAQARRDQERIEARKEMLFDDEFGICLDPCEHASVNGTTCAMCGEEVPF